MSNRDSTETKHQFSVVHPAGIQWDGTSLNDVLGTMIRAARFAAAAHQGQVRKGSDEPYITHPLGVSAIAGMMAGFGCVQADVVIAAILHDVLEDTAVTPDQIRQEFGEEVLRLVESVTEKDKSLPWEERKAKVLTEEIPAMSIQAVLLKTCDCLHNMRSLLEDIRAHGLEATNRKFSKSHEMRMTHQKKVCEALRERWDANPLIGDLQSVLIQIDQETAPKHDVPL